MERWVEYRYARVFPHPADAAYAWLTDYRDDDPALAGAVVRRREVVARREGVVTLRGEIEMLGRRRSGAAEVHLFPGERRWEARFTEGPAAGTVYSYRLAPLGPARTRLDVVYRARARSLRGWLKLQAARPLVRREVARMWDGFAAAMDRDLAP